MQNTIENYIGQKIRLLRLNQNLKQETLARELNMCRQTLSAYERGISLPDIYSLITIADYFEVTLDELVGRK